MRSGRLEAFSDGVIAIIITIMVLDLRVPRGGVTLQSLRPVAPIFLAYVLSFLYVGIYWNNHHHMLHMVQHVNGAILWANLHLLFWLSLVPFTTLWTGQSHFAQTPTAVYGFVLLMAALAYWILQKTIVRMQGKSSPLAHALKRDLKGNLSPVLYLAAIPLAFVSAWISNGLYLLVALIWLVPDRRIEKAIADNHHQPQDAQLEKEPAGRWSTTVES